MMSLEKSFEWDFCVKWIAISVLKCAFLLLPVLNNGCLSGF